MQFIENKTFYEISIGDSAELTRTLHKQDIELFAVMSGDVNPAHVDADYAKSDLFHRVIAHGMWGGALISAVLGTELPGPGTIYLNQSLSFRHPVGLGETVTARVKVREKIPDKHRVILDCECVNAAGDLVIVGEAHVIAPTQKVHRPRALLPELHLHERGERFRQLMEDARKHPAIRTAVVHPSEEASLAGALEASKQGFIVPILVGPKAAIRTIAERARLDLTGVDIVNAANSQAAAARAVALARDGQVDSIQNCALNKDVMRASADPVTGLRTERQISHVFVLDVPHYPKSLLITDAAVNLYPDLDDKHDIVQNAIDLARAIGIDQPKVAILSAVETVYPGIKSTIDAAALCKMADRGQITGGTVDGPLAFDNAVSKYAAKTKHIASSVAGNADILVVPDVEAGTMIVKQLIYLAGADAAGIALGARVPIIPTSPADNILAHLTSCALAQLFVHRFGKSAW